MAAIKVVSSTTKVRLRLSELMAWILNIINSSSSEPIIFLHSSTTSIINFWIHWFLNSFYSFVCRHFGKGCCLHGHCTQQGVFIFVNNLCNFHHNCYYYVRSHSLSLDKVWLLTYIHHYLTFSIPWWGRICAGSIIKKNQSGLIKLKDQN